MNKPENPINEVALRFVDDLDLSRVDLIEQAPTFYKSLHSQTRWLEAYHQECEPVNQLFFEGKSNCEFYDSVLTAFVYQALEIKLGAPRSSLQIALQEIEAISTEIETGSYQLFLSVYPRNAWNAFKDRFKESPYPWLHYKENLLLVFMVAFHSYYWQETVSEPIQTA